MVTSSVVDLVSANLRIRTLGCWITTLGVRWLWPCPSLGRRSRASFTLPATFGAFPVSFFHLYPSSDHRHGSSDVGGVQDVLLVHLPGGSDGDGGFRVDRFVSPPSRVFFSRFGSLEDLPTQEHGRHHQSSGPPRLHGRVVVRRQRRRRRMQSTDDQSYPFTRSFETNTSGNPPFPSRTTIHGGKEEEATPRIHPKKRNERATTNKETTVDGNVHPMHVLARNIGKASERQQQQRRRGRIVTFEDSHLDAIERQRQVEGT